MYPGKIERLALLLGGFLAAGAALAYKSDKQQPINIQADHADFRADPNNNSNGIVMTADKAIVHVVNNELDTADITGKPATFQQQPDNGGMIHAYADEVAYDAGKNLIDLIGEARLLQPVAQANGAVVPVPAATTAHAPAPGTTHAPASATAAFALYVSQGERLMTADHIRYNTDTQHMLATASKEDGRVHITFPPKQLPGENSEVQRAREEDFENQRTAAAASHAAAVKAARIAAARAAASKAAAPAASTHPTAAPAAATHPGA
jgi:lipopolysaccharide transport protein LptA